MYSYGEEISYDFGLLKVEDYEFLQPFECGNKKLDTYLDIMKGMVLKIILDIWSGRIIKKYAKIYRCI
ncbi:MAG: hypothetical protein HFI31_11935 [Lachnospiraceae bacterium]|nr:hypothetical protein [Lachnospiraceae bacterium]